MRSKTPSKEDIAKKVDYITKSYPTLAALGSPYNDFPILTWASSTNLNKVSPLLVLARTLDDARARGMDIGIALKELEDFKKQYSDEIPAYIKDRFRYLQQGRY